VGKSPLFSPSQAPRLAVQGWLTSRLVLLVVLLVLVWLNDWSVAEAVERWDVNHFLAIADHGYPDPTDSDLTPTAFFPGLPLVMAFFALFGIPAVASGTLLALVGSGMAAWALYRLAGGGVKGTVAVWAWSFAPMAVFTVVPYTESPFCALAFWSFHFAKRDRWVFAALLAAGASTFRVSGLFLIGALGLVALFGFSDTWKRLFKRVVWLAIPTAVIAAYAIYLRIRYDSWTMWFSAQAQGWGRTFDWPWNAFLATLPVARLWGDSGFGTYQMFRWEVVAFLIGLAISVVCFVRKKIPEGGWVLVQVLALSSQVWLISIARSMLLWFPVFTMIGDIGGGEVSPNANAARRVGLSAFLVFEFLAMIWWASRFFTGAWAG